MKIETGKSGCGGCEPSFARILPVLQHVEMMHSLEVDRKDEAAEEETEEQRVPARRKVEAIQQSAALQHEPEKDSARCQCHADLPLVLEASIMQLQYEIENVRCDKEEVEDAESVLVHFITKRPGVLRDGPTCCCKGGRERKEGEEGRDRLPLSHTPCQLVHGHQQKTADDRNADGQDDQSRALSDRENRNEGRRKRE